MEVREEDGRSSSSKHLSSCLNNSGQQHKLLKGQTVVTELESKANTVEPAETGFWRRLAKKPEAATQGVQ